MADTPNIPIIPDWIHSWGAFVKHHERLILIVAASLTLWHFSGTIRGYFDAKHLQEQAQINQQIAASQAQNAALTQQIADMQKNFNESVQALNAKIDAKKQQVIIQQKKDDVMPPVELSARWADLIHATPDAVAPTTDGRIGVSIDASHTTVNQLERIPQLEEQITDEQTKTKACTELSAKKDDSIAGLKDSLKLEKDGRAADAKVAKDNQRKSFWKGTKFGAILTGVGVVAIKIAVIAAK